MSDTPETTIESGDMLKSCIALRRGRLGAATRRTNEIKALMTDVGNVNKDNDTFEAFKGAVDEFNLHKSVQELLSEEQKENDYYDWYEPRITNLNYFMKYVETWKRDHWTAYQMYHTKHGLPLTPQHDVCKRKWKNLRDTYLKELKKERENHTSRAGATMKQPWRFMAPASQAGWSSGEEKARHQPASSQQAGTSSQQAGTSSQPAGTSSQQAGTSSQQAGASRPAPAASRPAMGKRRRPSELSIFEERMKDILETPTPQPATTAAVEDEDDLFFLSLLPDLKRLPKAKKANVKFRIHQIIYEAGEDL
ncbi:hypothetical protein N1851_014502 [Merluccius polli]|uniref:BESS domain-containing protein n=1 Tax=Merluccius polli TaxID=89951 RepID=A0AA47MU29_MERPO|nr:hypothetical protein N1851_014502 [Merluccius polli]